jgi:hypothetical protein
MGERVYPLSRNLRSLATWVALPIHLAPRVVTRDHSGRSPQSDPMHRATERGPTPVTGATSSRSLVVIATIIPGMSHTLGRGRTFRTYPSRSRYDPTSHLSLRCGRTRMEGAAGTVGPLAPVTPRQSQPD